MQLVSHSPGQTQKIASALAKKIAGQKGPVIVTLQGELGAGKTMFVQGFVRALGIKAKVKSPTFLLIKHYSQKTTGRAVYHVDCYRIMKWQDLRSLDIEAILKDPRNIVLIEWPERIKPILPKHKTKVVLHHKNPRTRTISIS